MYNTLLKVKTPPSIEFYYILYIFYYIPYFNLIRSNYWPICLIVNNKKITFETAYVTINGIDKLTIVTYLFILKTPSMDRTVQISINNEKRTPAKIPNNIIKPLFCNR